MERKIQLEKEIQALKFKLAEKEKELNKIKNDTVINKYSDYFTKNEIKKYCRQIIVNSINVRGQIKIKNSKVLIVGVGGLGCPAAQYLAAAGVGTIGLLDHDKVNISNLHRQILFGENDNDMPKVQVAANKLNSMHRNINIIQHYTKITRENAEKIFKSYDVILDCTDNHPTRYLVNDVAALLKKPLVLGNALKTQGQFFSVIPKRSPCYRCMHPEPIPAECVMQCNDSGVLGVVTGIVGVCQAFEALKIINFGDLNVWPYENNKMIVYDTGNFREIVFRMPNGSCSVCGQNPKILLDSLPDYEQWCNQRATGIEAMYPPEKILTEDKFVTVNELSKLISTENVIIIDVRSKNEYEMCRLKQFSNLYNFPLTELKSSDQYRLKLYELIKENIDSNKSNYVLFICRCGNDSQRTVKLLEQNLQQELIECNLKIKDIFGGLYSWQKIIDNNFPIY